MNELSTLNLILSQSYENNVLLNSPTFSGYTIMACNMEDIHQHYQIQIYDENNTLHETNNILLSFDIKSTQKQVINTTINNNSSNQSSQYYYDQSQNSNNIIAPNSQMDELRSEYDNSNPDQYDVPIKLVTVTKVKLDLKLQSITLRLGDFEFRFLKNILDISNSLSNNLSKTD